MARVLIHTSFIGGHQLEYIHHLYIGAMHQSEREFVIAVPKQFETDSKNLGWPYAENIEIVTISYNKQYKGLFATLFNARLLGRLVKKYNIDEVVVVSLMDYMPFLPLFVSGKVKVKGIIYRIYLYDWKQEGFLKKIVDSIIYTLFSRFKVFDSIFMLNDNSASVYLCKLFKTNKYKYLPDPVPIIPNYRGNNLRGKMGVNKENIVLLHPGGMLPYKGTLNILNALLCLDEESCKKITMVFAGRANSVQPEFGSLLTRVQKKMQVFNIDGYIPFEQLEDLFVSCDYVLIPYTTNNKSSGIVGNAAFFNKPVIVAKGGVIGKMVRRWNLGYMMSGSSIQDIVSFIKTIPEPKDFYNSYASDHTIEQFGKVLLS